MTNLALSGVSTAARDIPNPNGGIDFVRLVGRDGWWRLAEGIRRRFSHRLAPGECERFTGTMHSVASSRLGFMLAQICRLIGTPFAPFRGADIPVSIVLRPSGDGVEWERVYFYPRRAAIRVASTKRLSRDGMLTECVGFGIGMRLDVYEADAALHFRSRRYFLRLAGYEIPLPHFLSPGVAHVIHSDLGGESFRFQMTFRHRWFGTLFSQDGVFQPEGVTS